ncbi:toxin-antitoxin system YwqK family antitoxin [Ichthyenterobacterium magnum]|uniref:MORN repeat protein n=1 Tax=Ichthyenterobacterium magnum TaxID=1230530 RepID=A0A420DV55_9FLAO|nr:toxin-antitoxin system YwqK family antitoxin [Ichthyenterobacterium magnum]RKE98038.1 MORN repeat protein [Ichthyenterobacterium magnum]
MNKVYIIILTLVSIFSFGQEINQFDADGKRHGNWRKNFDKTKQIRYEGQFNHGKEVGTFKFYTLKNKKSVLSAKKVFNDSNNIASVQFLSSSGKLISEGQMNGKLYIGSWTFYHNKTKAIMSTEQYNDKGELDGKRIVYYKDGRVAEKANYINGKQEGLSIWYSDKGLVLKEFTYKNDELHGLSKYYNVNGTIEAEGNYQKGRKHGIWKYYKNGKLYEEKDHTRRSKNPKKQ